MVDVYNAGTLVELLKADLATNFLEWAFADENVKRQ